MDKRGFLLVEATGVEPVSENLFTQLSTSVVYRLTFPPYTADKQAVYFSNSPYISRAGVFPADVHH